MKKLIIILTGLVVLAAFGLFILPVLLNDLLLSNYSNSIINNLKSSGFHIDLKTQKIGVLFGCGNHLDMQVIVSIKTNKNPETIHQIISGYQIVSPFSQSNLFSMYKNFDGKLMGFLNNEVGWVTPEFIEEHDRADFLRLSDTGNYIIEYIDQEYSGYSMLDHRAH